ncbi:MAG: hypothetical protein M3N16_09215 [Actinomycetota bacterium]|nr:hypothetical protein [Actinomycetota bacterium]
MAHRHRGRRIRRAVRRPAPRAAARDGERRVTLVSESNFLLYTPIPPGAAAGTLEPRHVVVPLREELERTNIRLGRVTGADPDRSELRLRGVEGREERLGYDHLRRSETATTAPSSPI